jgi:hypothetical protein
MIDTFSPLRRPCTSERDTIVLAGSQEMDIESSSLHQHFFIGGILLSRSLVILAPLFNIRMAIE